MDGASDLVDSLDDQPFGAPIPRAFRLSDAERIAANRLDGAAEGSLKEALATKIVEPAPEGQSLVERLDQVTSQAMGDSAPLRVFQAAPEATFGWINAVPPAHAVPFFDVPEAPADAVQQAAELMPDACLDTSWVKEWSTLKDEQEVHVETVPVDEPAASIAMELEPELRETTPDYPSAVAEGAVAAMGADDMPLETSVELAPIIEEATAISETVEPAVAEEPVIHEGEEHPGHVLTADPKLEPIVNAFAANARLAADATAASQALHHLKKLLSEQLSEPMPGTDASPEAMGDVSAPRAAQQPLTPQPIVEIQPVHAGARQGMATAGAIRTEIPEVAAAAAIVPTRQAMSPAMPPPLPPMAPPDPTGFERRPALPQDVPAEELPKCVVGKAVAPPADRSRPQAPVGNTRSVDRAESAMPAASTVKDVVRTQRQMMKKAPPPKPQERRRRTFDFRGFAAGFALSGAIGLLLYFVMSTS